MMIVSGTANLKSIDSNKSKQRELAKNEKPRHSPTSLCTTCGRFAHVKGPCPHASNKYANKTNAPFVDSTAHALLVKETGNKNWIPDSDYDRRDKRESATPAPALTGAPGEKPFEKREDYYMHYLHLHPLKPLISSWFQFLYQRRQALKHKWGPSCIPAL